MDKTKETNAFIEEKADSGNNCPKANKKYKDTLFRMLFNDKKNLLELYNALRGTSYVNENKLEIVTLENAIYMNMKNDIAFLIADYLNMFEHQSTKNPNMPLRDLLYIAREYEKLVNRQSLYFSSVVKIPAPYFVVFYNGADKYPEKKLLKLSDLYITKEENPALELKVLVLNINSGYNTTLFTQCQTLWEYTQYIEKVRSYTRKMPVENAVDCAVTECIKENILASFLEKYRREVVQMSIFEYDEEKELQLIRQNEREQGINYGIKLGEENKLKEQIQKKITKGKSIAEIAEDLEENIDVIRALC